MAEVRRVSLGEVAFEYKRRLGEKEPTRPIYGVDKNIGLTKEPRYQSSDLSRYKLIENGMFAYNPMRLNIGSIGFCDDGLPPGAVSPDYVVFACHESALLPKFLDFHTRSASWNDWLSFAGEGSVRERIYFRKLENYELTLPTISYQASAVAILSAIEDKIALNRRINETLDVLVRELFRDWFVEYGPVRRKLAGVTDPMSILGGIVSDPVRAAEIANLFPGRFGDGDLPDGWVYQAIGDQAEAVGGSTPSTKSPELWEPAQHYWATPKDLSSKPDFALFETERSVSSAGLARITSGLLPVGTVLLSSRAPIGYLAITQVPAAINQGFIALLPNRLFPSAYLYSWCRVHMGQITSNANGSTFQEISKRNFRPILSAVPESEEILLRFAALAEPLIDKIVAGAGENRTLSETRDYLLPKLLSGEAHMNDVNDMAG